MYILITAAKNEAIYIGQTIESVITQTIKPIQWVIVDDGSTDSTPEIIRNHNVLHPWISLLMRQGGIRNFGSQALSLNFGWNEIKKGIKANSLSFEYVGVLDADITLPEYYYERVMEHLCASNKLALAGGWVHEPIGKGFKPRANNNEHSVPGAIQFFKRAVFEKIGGFVPTKYGGLDWIASIEVERLGYQCRAFKELPVFHHKPSVYDFLSGVKYALRQGRMDASLGCLFLYHLARDLKRVSATPFLINSVIRLAGYLYERARGECVLHPGTLSFFRKQQRERLLSLLPNLIKAGKPTH
jgi:glycosyltransferase involved in cell wall biosynthesis